MREIPEELWKKLIQETLGGIIKILDSADILVQNGGNEFDGFIDDTEEEMNKLRLGSS